MSVDLSQELIKSLRPIRDLMDLGVLYMLNRDYFVPNGFIIALYVDDDDGQTALGWACLPLDVAREMGIYPLDEDDCRRREEAFDKFSC